ncbi:MAG: hypothetical protein V3V30_02575 [Parvularculaceae bacterium]
MSQTPEQDISYDQALEDETIEQPRRRQRRAPLIPEAGAAGAPLTAVIAVICFLASIALSGFFLVNRAADSWTNDLKGALTIQVTGATPAAIDLETEKVLTVVAGRSGIVSAHALSQKERAKLLKPWLGTGLSDEIPVPGIISVALNTDQSFDIDLLRDELAVIAPNATVDAHDAWNQALASSAMMLKLLAFIIFLLVMAAACAIIIFAAKAGLAANRQTITLLHLVGATDAFIAQEVQRRFLILGLRGAMIGVSVAAAILFLISFGAKGGAATGYFTPALKADIWSYSWLLIVPLLTCLVSATTARITTISELAKQF